ncbi:hypothetical protein FB451DRAFT_1479144 [Mycena latifolia]|nr:hypothetical protein FB451DRAFT_1479144 [Mycena latifolia]
MTYTISVAHTLAVITVLPIGLIGLEHAASYLLNILRALATTHRFSLFFATSVVSVGAHHVYTFWIYGARMEAESEADYLFGDDLGTTTPWLRRFIPTWQAASPSTASYDYARSPHQNYSPETRHPRLSALRVIVPTSPPEIRPVRSGVCFSNASRFKVSPMLRVIASHPTLEDHQQDTVKCALQLNPLPHKYAPKSTFLSHFLFQDLLRCKPVMIPYSYTPSHKRSWAVDAPSTAEDEHFPVEAIPTAPRAQPKSKALANAAASMPSVRKPENRARAAATPLSAAHNRPAGSSAPSLPTRALHVPEPVSPSPIRVQQPAATPPPLSSATSKGAAPPTQRMQAPLPKGNPVPPTSAYIPSSARRRPHLVGVQGQVVRGRTTLASQCRVAPSLPLANSRPTTDDFSMPPAKGAQPGGEDATTGFFPLTPVFTGPAEVPEGFVPLVRLV